MRGSDAKFCACRAVAELMRKLPLRKLRNFGGKLGAELAELGCTTAGQARTPETSTASGVSTPQRSTPPHK